MYILIIILIYLSYPMKSSRNIETICQNRRMIFLPIMTKVWWKMLELKYTEGRESFFFKTFNIFLSIYFYLDHMKRNRPEISKCYAKKANNVYYSIEINEVRWKTLEFTYNDNRDSFLSKRFAYFDYYCNILMFTKEIGSKYQIDMQKSPIL